MKSFNQFTGKVLSNKPTLNPDIWNTDTNKLQDIVRFEIINRAEDFVERLGLKAKDIEDVRIIGGNASYNWDDESDIDATVMIRRDLNLSKQEIRRLGIAASNLTYRLQPSINGIDLNYYLSSRNVGGLRPAKQSVYSLFKDKFLVGPGSVPETDQNFIASKASFIIEQVESCLMDEEKDSDGCAEDLLRKLKRYRAKGLASKFGEYSTPNLVWRTLSRSGYIKTLKDKVQNLEKDYYKIQTPTLIRNEEFRTLIKHGEGPDTIPVSILGWSKRILKGENPMEFISRCKMFIELFKQSEIVRDRILEPIM